MSLTNLIFEGFYYAEAYCDSTDEVREWREFRLLFREDGFIWDFQDYVDEELNKDSLDNYIAMNQFYHKDYRCWSSDIFVGRYTLYTEGEKLFAKAIFPDFNSFWNRVGAGIHAYNTLHVQVENGYLLNGVHSNCYLEPMQNGEIKRVCNRFFFDRARVEEIIVLIFITGPETS